jgi:hypothetical protein
MESLFLSALPAAKRRSSMPLAGIQFSGAKFIRRVIIGPSLPYFSKNPQKSA